MGRGFSSDKFMVDINQPPDFVGLIDQDILDRFQDSSVFWGDIINAQLIKTNKELIEVLKQVLSNA